MTLYIKKLMIEVSPLYFPDKDYVVIAYENIVEVCDLDHKIVWRFENNYPVTTLEYLNNQESKFYLVLQNGNIKLCDLDTNEIIDIIHININVKNAFFTNEDLLTIENESINFYPKFDLTKKKVIVDKILDKVAFAKNTGVIAMIDKTTLNVICVKNDKKIIHKLSNQKKKIYFTTVACHPNEITVATGDSEGLIFVWWNVLNGSTKTHYHWHFLSLNTLEFNYDGTHLLSGGREHTLVKWQLSITDGEKRKRFLPRLESEIIGIRSCTGRLGEHYLVTLADNSYKIATKSLTVKDSSYGLIQRPAQLQNKIAKLCKLNTIPIKNCHNLPKKLQSCIAMNGHEGDIQFFDLKSQSTIYQLDVASQNWPVESENYLIPGFVQVQLSAFSNCGSFIATYECLGIQNQKDIQPAIKIFRWNDVKEIYELEKQVEVDWLIEASDIIFHPNNKDHIIIITKSLKLLMLSRKFNGGHPTWVFENRFELEEMLYRYKINIANLKKSVPSLVSIKKNATDALLLITMGDCIAMYKWSYLLKGTAKPLVAVTIETLTEDLDMVKEQKSKLTNTIVSAVILKSPSSARTYRIVLGLSNGLIIVETVLNIDKSVDLKSLKGALSIYPVKRLSNCSADLGTSDKVAVLFEGSNNLKIFPVWDNSQEGVQSMAVKELDDFVWVPTTNSEQWGIVGLVRDINLRTLVFCDDATTQCYKQGEIVIKKEKPLNVVQNPLLMAEDADVPQPQIMKRVLKRQTRPWQDNILLYDAKSAPSTSIVIKKRFSIK